MISDKLNFLLYDICIDSECFFGGLQCLLIYHSRFKNLIKNYLLTQTVTLSFAGAQVGKLNLYKLIDDIAYSNLVLIQLFKGCRPSKLVQPAVIIAIFAHLALIYKFIYYCLHSFLPAMSLINLYIIGLQSKE